mgnify:CR=1 FL=1
MRLASAIESWSRTLAIATGLALLAGCGAPGPLIPEQQQQARDQAPLPPAPESYRVAAGDTLYSIAFNYGLDWRRVAAWNGIDAPYTIRVDDRIRLRPPPDMRPASTRRGGERRAPEAEDKASEPPSDPQATEATAATEARPDPPPQQEPAPPPRARVPIVRESDTETAAAEPEASVPEAETRSVAGVAWRWPTSGRIARRFDPGATRKGVLIAGEVGQPIRSAARGQVVYSGNGLIGYGELVIIKHSEQMLSAYAHNRERLVAEGQQVEAGAVIGRMGLNERNETVLHFEIRRNGKPDDPLDYLPRR